MQSMIHISSASGKITTSLGMSFKQGYCHVMLFQRVAYSVLLSENYHIFPFSALAGTTGDGGGWLLVSSGGIGGVLF